VNAEEAVERPTAIIMCQGNQQRIGHLLDGPKQLIKVVDQETIFERTVRLVRAAGVSRVVAVIHPLPQWPPVCARAGVETYVQPDPGGSVVGAIMNLREFWGDRTIILLGDVIFSVAAIRAIVASSGAVFFGRRGKNPVTGKRFGELFGLAFSEPDRARLILETSSAAGWSHHQDTKLWGLLEKVHPGWPLIEISDYTDDMDTHDDYTKRLPVIRAAAAKDLG